MIKDFSNLSLLLLFHYSRPHSFIILFFPSDVRYSLFLFQLKKKQFCTFQFEQFPNRITSMLMCQLALRNGQLTKPNTESVFISLCRSTSLPKCESKHAVAFHPIINSPLKTYIQVDPYSGDVNGHIILFQWLFLFIYGFHPFHISN